MTISDLINELSNLIQIHGPDAPARIWNTNQDAIQPLEARGIAGVTSGWCVVAQRQIATLRIADQ